MTVTAEPVPAESPSETSTSAEAEQVEQAVVEEQSADPTPEAKPRKPKPAAGGTGRGGWTMPDEVGKNLQAAQDHMQLVTDDPFFFTASDDATGAFRFQVLDANWRVCDQTPAAGQPFGYNTDIVFYVVKDYEDCP